MTKDEFIALVRKGWHGKKLCKDAYYKKTPSGNPLNWEESEKFCAIGAAGRAADVHPKFITNELPRDVFRRVVEINDRSRSKAEILRRLEAMEWPQ